MITSFFPSRSISTNIKDKIIDYYVEGESVTQEDVAKVDAEIIQELEELYNNEDQEEL